MGFHFSAGKKSFGTFTAFLPASDARPVPSSSLVADPPRPQDETTLQPWTITALRLSPAQTVELLCASMGKQILSPGIVVGKDVFFWAQALRFAASLVARQQFLPGLAEEDGGVSAKWKPVIHGPDGERFAVLAGAMPAVSRAVRGTGKSLETTSDAPAAPSPVSLLSFFIEKVVDHLVRSAGLWLNTGGLRGDSKDFESSHDQWLHSLRTGDGAMAGSPMEWAELIGQIQEWQRPLAISAASPFRLCFRLEEPNGNEDQKEKAGLRMASWYVRYLLQAAQDPSLLIPAEEAWKAKDRAGKKGRSSSPLLQDGFDPREYLLLSLGQASGIWPRIEASLAKPAPAGYELDAAGAHDFLTQKALALRQAGYGVMLPAWWTGLGTKDRLTARASVQAPRMQGTGGLSLDEIVKFDWEVALGGEGISFEELQALARLKVPLVKLRGQWVQVNAEEIEAALALWKKKGQATAREIVQMALG